MFTNEDRQNLFDLFLSVVKGIADKNYQRRVWIEAQGSEIDDFDETSIFFFNTCDSILKHGKELKIDRTKLEMLKRFHDEFEKFSHENDCWPPFFIDTPEWTRITEMAQEVLQAFKCLRRIE